MKRISILLTALSFGLPGYGLLFVVPSGETEITTLTLPDDGDRAIIEGGGAISTAGSPGVVMNNDNQETLNSGRISTTGDMAQGIINAGDNAVITNSGTISTTGTLSSGIFNAGGDNAIITNNGTISTTGDGAHGIANTGDNTVVVSNGTILTTGLNSNGIDNAGTNFHVLNSGTIRSAEALTLNLTGANPTVTLLRGSNLQGPVRTIDLLNLNVETGLNLALTLTNDSVGFANLGITAPFVRVGNTIAVIDPTGLALQADVIADLSDTILSGIYRCRLHCCNCCCQGLWVQGIGSYCKRNHDRFHVGYDNWHGGFIAGYNRSLCQGRAGVFAGASFAEAEVDQHTQHADINSYFGGLTYETCFCGSFVGLALAVGYVNWDNTRYVMNNLAINGIEVAHADINGPFISPEMIVTHTFSMLRCHPVASFTFRYAGFFPGDYHEKGSLANLGVKDRQIDLLTTRFEIANSYCSRCRHRCWSLEPYIGVFGRYQVGGFQINGELLGQQIDFNQEGPRNLAAFLLGFRGGYSIGCLNLFFNLEGSFDTASSARILGEGGVSCNF